MANDTNWEAQHDWSKIDPVGGIGFYSFAKGSVLKSMDEGLGQLVAIKEDKERKLGSCGRSFPPSNAFFTHWVKTKSKNLLSYPHETLIL